VKECHIAIWIQINIDKDAVNCPFLFPGMVLPEMDEGNICLLYYCQLLSGIQLQSGIILH